MNFDILMAKLSSRSTWPSDSGPTANGLEAKPLLRQKARGACGTGSLGARRSGITALDVAGAMGMADLPETGELLMRGMYCDDGAAMIELINILADAIAGHMEDLGKSKFTVREFCEGCALSVLTPFYWGVRCSPCGSTGTISGKACSACGGSGVGEYSQRAQCERAGIPRDTWRRHWQSCADHFRSMMVEIETECEIRIIEQLIGDKKRA